MFLKQWHPVAFANTLSDPEAGSFNYHSIHHPPRPMCHQASLTTPHQYLRVPPIYTINYQLYIQEINCGVFEALNDF